MNKQNKKIAQEKRRIEREKAEKKAKVKKDLIDWLKKQSDTVYNAFLLVMAKELENLLASGVPVAEMSYSEKAIRLRLICKYDENDDLSNIGNTILMDLDDEN